ncbi:hypothetical protein COX23_05590 [Candidatus Gottesmanbacteria bacterium CG23_combo_of_CG06-09_8_20_14_all_37_19]|nr:MAG: hypothetical protein COX23_05590 [Candidatus Gottesmanbacteria bacterium CG23_combo_of_CG06-09_8_20_14_all_37_19]
MKTVYAFMNSYTQGKSGGDMAFIEIFKRIKNIELTIITSTLGKKLCQDNNLKADFLITTKEIGFKNIILTYFKRIARGISLGIELKVGDILYATSDALPDTMPVFFLKIKNKKTKWIQKIFHLIPKERFLSHWSQKISFFLTKKLADVVIVDNDQLKMDLAKMGFPKNKLFVNHLGVDFDYFKKILPSKISYDGIFMARLHHSKGIFDLVQIWKNVVEKLPKVKLAIIGQGEQKVVEKLTEEIKSNHLENNIDLLGYLENVQAFSLIKAAKLFIFPSHEEGFGLVIIEALACGTPVIAYDLLAYNHTFKPTITTISLNDHKQFSTMIYNLLMNERGRKKVIPTNKFLINRFSWDRMAKKEVYLFDH